MKNIKKTEIKKRKYIEEIRKNEPIRPEELPFNRVRYDYLIELEIERKIERKKYTQRYTLLFMPGHEQLADERYADETGNKWNLKRNKLELQLDFTNLISDWLEQLPQVSVSNGFIKINKTKPEEIPYPPLLAFKRHPLFPDFKKYVENLLNEYPDFFPNPFIELEKFTKKARDFFEKRKELIKKIFDIVREDIGQDIEPSTKVPAKLIRGILLRIAYGLGWKSGDFTDEWFRGFLRFHSSVVVSSKFYDYYLRDFQDERYFRYPVEEDDFKFEGSTDRLKYAIPISIRVDKSSISKELFRRNMDKKIRSMLMRIGGSKEIREIALHLKKLEKELCISRDNMWKALEKIKSIK